MFKNRTLILIAITSLVGSVGFAQSSGPIFDVGVIDQRAASSVSPEGAANVARDYAQSAVMSSGPNSGVLNGGDTDAAFTGAATQSQGSNGAQQNARQSGIVGNNSSAAGGLNMSTTEQNQRAWAATPNNNSSTDGIGLPEGRNVYIVDTDGTLTRVTGDIPEGHYHAVYDSSGPDARQNIYLGRGFQTHGGHVATARAAGISQLGIIDDGAANVIASGDGRMIIGGRAINNDNPRAAATVADFFADSTQNIDYVTEGRMGMDADTGDFRNPYTDSGNFGPSGWGDFRVFDDEVAGTIGAMDGYSNNTNPRLAGVPAGSTIIPEDSTSDFDRLMDMDSRAGDTSVNGSTVARSGVRIIAGTAVVISHVVAVADVISVFGAHVTEETIARANANADAAQANADSFSDAESIWNGTRATANTAAATAAGTEASRDVHENYQPGRDAVNNFIGDNIINPLMNTAPGQALATVLEPVGIAINEISDLAASGWDSFTHTMNNYGADNCVNSGSCSYSSDSSSISNNDINGLSNFQVTADTVFDWEREGTPEFDRNGSSTADGSGLSFQVTDNPIYNGQGWQDDTVFNSRADALPGPQPAIDLSGGNPDPSGNLEVDLTVSIPAPTIEMNISVPRPSLPSNTETRLDAATQTVVMDAVNNATRPTTDFTAVTGFDIDSSSNSGMESNGMGTRFDTSSGVDSWSSYAQGGTWTQAGAGTAGGGGAAAGEDFMKTFFMESIGLDLDRLTVHYVDEGGGGGDAYLMNLAEQYTESDDEPNGN